MNAGPLSEPSDVVGTGLGDRSYRNGILQRMWVVVLPFLVSQCSVVAH